jgi:hypothetical protein
MHINTTEFAEGQIIYNEQSSEITANFRVVFRDLEHNVVDSLTQTFTVIITDNEDEDPCAGAELELASAKARTVYEVVFTETGV